MPVNDGLRHYMVDPDNEDRLLKVPRQVIAKIKAEALSDAVQRVESLRPRLQMTKHEGGYFCCGCFTLDDLFEDCIAVIKGEQP